MCGITGYIGESKNTKISYSLITSLFKHSESRGIDASGFWATEVGVKGEVLYFKEPTRSSKFVKKDSWNNFLDKNCDLIIAHARGASVGVGEPFFNENNHPFVTSNRTIALAHNGRIAEVEYQHLKNRYETTSDCDSEVLLRLLESDIESNNLIDGIRNIFCFTNESHMAVAIGKRYLDNKRELWLFRNEHRPLWVCDLRKELGQIFFFSELKIWFNALNEINTRFNSSKIDEVPIEEIWNFNLEREITIKKYKIKKIETKEFLNEEYFYLNKENCLLNINSNLDENDQIIKNEKIESHKDKEIEDMCNQIIEKIKEIKNISQHVSLEKKEEIKKELLNQKSIFNII